jgi:AcrR family transcriptional regulator
MDTDSPPRKRNAAESRARILSAAQQAFAEIGYSQAGIREIAAIAGVSSTLLLRYYGSKAGLYEAALTKAMNMDWLAEREKAGFADYIASVLVHDEIALRPPAMVQLAMGDDKAREIAAKVTQEHNVAPLAAWLGPPDAEARALKMLILATGYLTYARQVPIVPSSGRSKDQITAWLTESLRAIIDQSE